MYISIYQVQSERDQQGIRCMPLSYLKAHDKVVDPQIYDRVFQGEVEGDTLEDIYALFNMEEHPLLHGHSMSVSDIVVMEGRAYYCDAVGFEEVDFPEEQAHTENLLKVLYVEQPYKTEIPNRLRFMQQAVQGLIEFVPLSDNVTLVCNEEGKINGMQGNRRIEGDVIAGPFFIVGDDAEEGLRSLTEDEMNQYMERFQMPEDITQEEVEANLKFEFRLMDY